MDITGKIIAALPERGGVSARTGNPWKVQTFVLETHDQYPRKMAFDVFGEDKIKSFNIQIGQELTVSFDIDAREYNGNWYNSIRAWKVAPATQAPQAGADIPPYNPSAQPAPAPFPNAAPAEPAQPAADTASDGNSADDLPF